MTKYVVTYQETLARTLIVEADSYDEAANKMLDAVERGYIWLTMDDYVFDSGDVVDIHPATAGDQHWYHILAELI